MSFLDYDEVPLSEYDRTQPILSLAFPSLFPYGDGNYCYTRKREVSFNDYIDHLMRFYDRRFAKHPRFPYFAFNTIMRR